MTAKEVIQQLHNNAIRDGGIHHPELEWCESCGANIICYEFKHKFGKRLECLGCGDSWHELRSDPCPFITAEEYDKRFKKE